MEYFNGIKEYIDQSRGTEIEKKVKAATSTENWGASRTVKEEISQATYSYEGYNEVMGILWARMTDPNSNWKTVMKCLELLEYLIRNGSDRIVPEARDRMYELRSLRDFKAKDESGKEVGASVREKSRFLVELLNDDDLLDEERQKADALRARLDGSKKNYGSRSRDDHRGHDSRSSSRYDDEYRGSRRDDDRRRRDKDRRKPRRKNSDDSNDYSSPRKGDRRNRYDDTSEEESPQKGRNRRKHDPSPQRSHRSRRNDYAEDSPDEEPVARRERRKDRKNSNKNKKDRRKPNKSKKKAQDDFGDFEDFNAFTSPPKDEFDAFEAPPQDDEFNAFEAAPQNEDDEFGQFMIAEHNVKTSGSTGADFGDFMGQGAEIDLFGNSNTAKSQPDLFGNSTSQDSEWGDFVTSAPKPDNDIDLFSDFQSTPAPAKQPQNGMDDILDISSGAKSGYQVKKTLNGKSVKVRADAPPKDISNSDKNDPLYGLVNLSELSVSSSQQELPRFDAAPRGFVQPHAQPMQQPYGSMYPAHQPQQQFGQYPQQQQQRPMYPQQYQAQQQHPQQADPFFGFQ